MEPFCGEIRLFAGNYAPRGWAFCNGELLPITLNNMLFALIGTTYGGDGITNFALPDLCSRVALGQSPHRVAGLRGGTESVSLASLNLPTHTHAAACSTSDRANTKDATNAFWSAAPEGGLRYAAPTNSEGTSQMDFDSIQPRGNSLPHENRIPILAVSYIISCYGIWPPRR